MIYGEYIFKAMSQADDREATARGWDELVRCKDCRHYTGKWCTIYSTKQFDINDIYKDDDDFCSQAERKEE